MHASLTAPQGLLNALVYGLTPAVRKKWRGLWGEVRVMEKTTPKHFATRAVR